MVVSNDCMPTTKVRTRRCPPVALLCLAAAVGCYDAPEPPLSAGELLAADRIYIPRADREIAADPASRRAFVRMLTGMRPMSRFDPEEYARMRESDRHSRDLEVLFYQDGRVRESRTLTFAMAPPVLSEVRAIDSWDNELFVSRPPEVSVPAELCEDFEALVRSAEP